MTKMSATFTRALAHGRAPAEAPSRAKLLAVLLRKRATAHNAGNERLEALLREQILWALPIERGDSTE